MTAWQDAWGQALERLELDVQAVEDFVAGRTDEIVPSTWSAPTALGAMPPALASRAQALLDRQRAAMSALGAALADTRRLRVLAQREHTTRHGAPPVASYVDVSA